MTKVDLIIARKAAHFLNRYIGKRLSMQEKAKDRKWEKMFEHQDKFSGSIDEDLKMFFYKDSLLSKYIYAGFEEDEIKFLKRFLKSGDTFIDIGSNIGLFSMHAAYIVGTGGKVIAFEPTPQTFERLNENVQLNQFGNIITNNIGLSDSEGNLKLNLSSNGHDAWNTFANPSEGTHDNQVEVPVITLDNYITDHNVDTSKVALIKIDVEGWEVRVIEGAANFLKQNNAPVLMVEFTESNAFAAGSNCYELYDLVVSLGYQWFTYDAISNALISEQKRLHYPYLNLIAIKDIESAKKRIFKDFIK